MAGGASGVYEQRSGGGVGYDYGGGRAMDEERTKEKGRGDVKKWINVKDRLPECDEMVLVSFTNPAGVHVEMALTTKHGFYYIAEGAHEYYEEHIDNVTHWMPLPEPPK